MTIISNEQSPEGRHSEALKRISLKDIIIVAVLLNIKWFMTIKAVAILALSHVFKKR